MHNAWTDGTLRRLQGSRFRARFALSDADVAYSRSRGENVVREHAHRFLAERIASATPHNDGRQTPWRGHPVFVAQHATATCCRGCVAKWHSIPAGRALTAAELDRLTELVMAWLSAQLGRRLASPLPASVQRSEPSGCQEADQ